ncbi:hypothetical protein AB986_08445 [Alkalihalobacillus macyae]|uniref:Uncharacterized protein n=1 Tax=Guptibacillus hwajinpoensis TaxID=208199 RepID=A0A0J6D1J3_9BACL|nr:hypothetical protein AB986_08445 [Alkalihalobacillus macyae]
MCIAADQHADVTTFKIHEMEFGNFIGEATKLLVEQLFLNQRVLVIQKLSDIIRYNSSKTGW